MPIYVYRCAQCDADLEVRQGFSEAPLTTCSECGGSLRRVLQPVGVIFKGSGFYSTDYRGGANGKAKAADGETKSATGSDSDGSTAKTAESKSGADKSTAGAASTSSSSPSSTATTKSD
jgi:putative FmdB family regulatory protein